MSIELQDDGWTGGAAELDTVLGGGFRTRPNVSGDLPTVFQVGPMFRRAVGGYDRFQVDTYVRWAEDELVAADRQREHLLARHLEAQAALADARALLAHSAAGGELLRVSRRIGSMLAAAADEAQTIRAEAENHRSVARAQAEVVTADAGRVLADATAEASRTRAEAATEAAARTAEAGRIVAAADQVRRDAHAEAARRAEEMRALEQRALESAQQLRQAALDEAAAARRSARAEILGALDTAREQRRRADAEAAALRDRLDREAAARRAVLLAEVAELERRRAALTASPAAAGPAPSARSPHARAYLDRIQDRLGRHLPPRTPRTLGSPTGERTAA